MDVGSLTIYHYRARPYDPETGRFMQRDPLGYVDGMSLYEYVVSNPIVYLDFLGLTPYTVHSHYENENSIVDISYTWPTDYIQVVTEASTSEWSDYTYKTMAWPNHVLGARQTWKNNSCIIELVEIKIYQQTATRTRPFIRVTTTLYLSDIPELTAFNRAMAIVGNAHPAAAVVSTGWAMANILNVQVIGEDVKESSGEWLQGWIRIFTNNEEVLTTLVTLSGRTKECCKEEWTYRNETPPPTHGWEPYVQIGVTESGTPPTGPDEN